MFLALHWLKAASYEWILGSLMNVKHLSSTQTTMEFEKEERKTKDSKQEMYQVQIKKVSQQEYMQQKNLQFVSEAL